MKFASGVIVLAVGVLAGLWAGSSAPQAAAQAAPEPQARYQVSAYAAQQGAGTFGHGCYILDTTTGELWHARSGGKTEKVSEKMR